MKPTLGDMDPGLLHRVHRKAEQVQHERTRSPWRNYLDGSGLSSTPILSLTRYQGTLLPPSLQSAARGLILPRDSTPRLFTYCFLVVGVAWGLGSNSASATNSDDDTTYPLKLRSAADASNLGYIPHLDRRWRHEATAIARSG